jgi:hypothetical protein
VRSLIWLALASCSFATVNGPAPPPQAAGDCTTSHIAPGLDVAGTVVGALGTAVGVAFLASVKGCEASHPPGYNNESCGAAAGFGVIVGVPSLIAAVVYGASAVYGFRRVGACRQAR